MSDFLWFTFSSAWLLFIFLLPLEWARSKSKKVCIIIISLWTILFSILNARSLKVNLDKISVNSVEKAWKEYVLFCKEEHISWNEITFPEWLDIMASE